MLAWIPGANVVYSVAAGGLLIYEGIKAAASVATLARMGLYLLADSATSEIPIVGWAVDTVFPGHLLAAKALQRDIEARYGPADAVAERPGAQPGDDARPVSGTATVR
jgi:hypothetical protein